MALAKSLKVSDIDCKDENGSLTTLRTGDGDFKFHLNDSGTWTMTYFEDSDDDLENADPQRFRLLLTEELADMAVCDYELLQLEAAVEVPFNVMGNNMILNGSF